MMCAYIFYYTISGQRKFKNYGDVISTIMKEEGPLGFWKGLSASYVGCIEGAVQWIIYEKIKAIFSTEKSIVSGSKPQARTPSPTEYFFAAAISKTAAICATYPHEVVRTRLREQSAFGAFKYNNFLQALRVIAKEEGRKGLYGGIGMHLIRSVPNSAIMFVTFEVVSAYLAKEQSKSSSR